MTRLLYVLTLTVFVLLVPALPAQQITLGTPIIPSVPTISSYAPVSMCVQPVSQVNAHPSIVVVVVGQDNRTLTFTYPNATVLAYDTDAEVTALIQQYQTRNYSTARTSAFTGSLWHQLFDRLVADFPASFSGGGTVQH